MKLDKLPPELAEEVKIMAWGAAWHTANLRKGNKGDAERNKNEFENHYNLMLEKSQGLGLSHSTLEHIKWMAWDAAWHTANTRVGLRFAGLAFSKDAKDDKKRFEDHARAVEESGELSQGLSDSIKWMAWDAAWHTANTRFGWRQDAEADRHRSDQHFSKIAGSVTLIDIRFFADKAKVLRKEPKTLIEQKVDNNSIHEQETKVKVEYFKGQTSSWEHKLGFSAGKKTGVKSGFNFVADGSIEVSFEASYENSWFGRTDVSECHTYEFPVQVGAKESITAKAVIYEVEMQVPYELEYEIGDVRRKVGGMWSGIACSGIQFSYC